MKKLLTMAMNYLETFSNFSIETLELPLFKEKVHQKI